MLSVNRQVYDEGSYVLWAKNLFSFWGVHSFNQWFADVSSAKSRIIRHIVIYYVLGQRGDHDAFDIVGQFWKNLVQCADLRQLDLWPTELPKDFVATLSRQLPLLKCLRVAGYMIVMDQPRWVWGLVHVDVRLDGVDIEGSSTDIESYWRLGPWLARSVAVVYKFEDLGRKNRERYCDTHSTAKLQLPGEEPHSIEVPLVGVPNSPATCARFQLEREEADRLRERREAREEELRRGDAMRLTRDLDRRQAAESHAAARMRESEKTAKQLRQEEARQSLQRNRHMRDHLATRRAERKRVRRSK
ncbi:hypothetical protein PG994_002216 [Apiospora phragmitis]|uniref:Uncharacterized protein n=1 Tax=Apiospora phragmitis TaxID=2905665 RepID=A0ABR1WVX3_9PEZI